MLKNGTQHRVKNYDIDPLLKKLSHDPARMTAFLKQGSINVSQFNNGDYKLSAHVNGDGGGAGGAVAGAVVAGTTVQAVYHGTLAGIGVVTSPILTPVGSAALVGTIRFWTAPAAAYATKVAALWGGITGGVLTGPV